MSSMGCRRALNLLLSSFFIFTAIFHVVFSVDDYSDDGSISINCGSEVEYYDDVTGRRYIPDQGFVDTGSMEDTSGVGTSQNLPTQVRHSRVFTEGKRNCYVLRLKHRGKYLIRALFRGTPFISALELRPITNSSIYPVEFGIALSTAYRYDFGYRPGVRWDLTKKSYVTFKPETNGNILQSIRYKDDPYDRIWSQDNDCDFNTSLNWYTVDEAIRNNTYSLPQDVWKTLGSPVVNCINVSFRTTNQNNTTPNYYAYFHFAEFNPAAVPREMSIYLNDTFLDQGPISPPYMEGWTKAYNITNVNEDIKLSICSVQSYPILNAIEIYEQVLISNIWTNPEDVNAYIFRGQNIVIAAIAVTLVIVVAIAIAVVWWKRKHKRQATISREIVLPKSGEADSGNSRYSKALQSKNPEFSYSQVLRITNNFQTVIGGGGFGKVYIGALEDGTRVAVKLLSENSEQGRTEYYYEAKILSKVHHANLVSLIGYCNDGRNMMLIYEYMPNGNLRQHLSENSATALDWGRRLDIAKHAAQGLDYLHNGCKPPIIHRDVKTSNILLDENWQAKIADFGLSRNSEIEDNTHTTAVAGTFAYMDPEYLNTQKMNKKSDVSPFSVRRPEISQVFVELKECLTIEKSEGSLTMSSIEFDTSWFPCPR